MKSVTLRVFLGLAGSLLVGFVACVGDSTGTDTSTGDAAPGADASSADAGAAADAFIATDAGANSPDSGTPSTYFDVTDVNNWSSYDLSDSAAFGATTHGFGGAVLAGKSVIFIPAPGGYGNGVVFRYDITAPFKTKASWTTFDANAVDPAGGYGGGIFDGANVFLMPYTTGKVLRFDTAQSFVDTGAWKVFPVSSLYAGALDGQAFDGQYFYGAPYDVNAAKVVRYDTTQAAAFQDAGAWSSYNISARDAGVGYFTAPAFDKRYLYFGSANDAKVTRFDTKSSFTVDSSWDVFDVSGVAPVVKSVFGAIFDGRYIYLPPFSNGTPASVTARYDTTKPFAQNGSWETFDVAQVDATAVNLHGGTFDGRYVYYPSYNNVGVIVRYDTTMPFAQKGSWQAFAISKVTGNVASYSGIVFDGEYVYLVPQATTAGTVLGAVTIPRFHAKTPASLPAFTASFQ